MSLPLEGYHSYEHYVSDLDRAKNFYEKILGYKQIGKATPQAVEHTGMEQLVMTCGKNINVILSKPVTDWSVAATYLKLHPEGIGFLNFRVSSLQKAMDFLNERKACFLYAPQTHKDDWGTLSQVAIATAISDVHMRFIEDKQYGNFGAHFEMTEQPGKYQSPHGFQDIDHMTVNVKSLQPLTAFYQDVLGFERFWGIEFHTNDVNPNLPVGSGLKSTVMWHKESGVKFANNEPAPPYFRNSQIDIYLNDNHGSGIQHIALNLPTIIPAMEKLQEDGGRFLVAPDQYYDRVPNRLKDAGFEGTIREDFKELGKNNILIDGCEDGYLLQVFSHELSRHFDDPTGGPLFYEIIQREGDQGFGGGNFRALFETIEVDQIALEKTRGKLPLETI